VTITEKSTAKKKQFKEGQLQATGTKIQAEHQGGRKEVPKHCDTFQHQQPSRICDITVRKTSSVRPIDAKECCTFCFTIFCSPAPQTYGKWYISCPVKDGQQKNNHVHSNHLPVQESHLIKPLSSLTERMLNVGHQYQLS
jgi:hypothetical protein